MSVERRVGAREWGVLAAFLGFAFLSPAVALVVQNNWVLSGFPTDRKFIEQATAEPIEITGIALLVSQNGLLSDAIIDVIVDGSATGLQVVVPSGTDGVFSARGLVNVPADSTFGVRWTIPPTGLRPVPIASVQFTLHTQPVSAAPVSTSSALGLGLLALLLAAFSVQRLRTPG
ncbi:MAG: hypothetical protein AAF690_10885 [Acidobacteriota bacterium]